MKKIMNKVNFAIVGIMASVAPAMAANEGLCELITKLGGLLKTLRTLAFIGAGFYIAQWAWDFIKAGEVTMEKVQNKGVGLLVGFVLLFSIGAVLGFLISAAGPNGSLDCVDQLKAW